MAATLIDFPIRTSQGSSADASNLQKFFGRARECLGRILNHLGIPALLANTTITDELSGQIIEIKRGILYTKLSVNGRDYYFDRITGKFGGTGSGCG